MSAGGGGGGEDSLDFELNLAPIIDCFTVLITFMLVSATFLSVSILEASVAPSEVISNDPPPPQETPPPKPVGVKVSMNLMATGDIFLKITGEETREQTLQRIAEGRNFIALGSELKAIKDKFPLTEKITLTADQSVEYEDVVHTLETTKKVIPTVLLGGF